MRRVGSLPQPLSRASAVALPDGRVLVAGGLAGGSSTDQILLGTPPGAPVVAATCRPPGTTRRPCSAGRRVPLRRRPGGLDGHRRPGRSGDRAPPRSPAQLDEPLSDLGAAVVGGHAYLVGGYTGTKYASAVLRYAGAGRTATVARLPSGLRYAGVAALGGRIYVAGGLTDRAARRRRSTLSTRSPAPCTGSERCRRRPRTAPSSRSAARSTRRRQDVRRARRSRPSSGSTRRAARPRSPPASREASQSRPRSRSPDTIVVLGGEGSNAVYELTPR